MFQIKVAEKIKVHISFNIFFFLENRAVYGMWKSNLEPGRPQMTWRMCIACWIINATNTHSEYAILLSFPQQQRLHERASILLYKYVACLVSSHEHISKSCKVN